MADLYIYKTKLEAIMLPGETAHLVTSNETVDVRCLAVGFLPEYEKDFGALTAAAWSRDNEDTNLEMPTNELSQLRMRINDDFKLEFNNLGPVKQWRTSKTNFYLRQWPVNTGEDFLKELLFKASEFFVWEDDTPRFDLYAELAQTKSRIIFTGLRYRCAKLPSGETGKIPIYVSGWPSGTGWPR